MAQIIDLNAIRQVRASKAYGNCFVESYFYEGNLLCKNAEVKEDTVKKNKISSTCEFEDETLFDYLDGEMDELGISRIEKHLSSCESCRDKLSSYKGLREVSQDLSSSNSLKKDIKSRLLKRLKSELNLRSDFFS